MSLSSRGSERAAGKGFGEAGDEEEEAGIARAS